MPTQLLCQHWGFELWYSLLHSRHLTHLSHFLALLSSWSAILVSKMIVFLKCLLRISTSGHTTLWCEKSHVPTAHLDSWWGVIWDVTAAILLFVTSVWGKVLYIFTIKTELLFQYISYVIVIGFRLCLKKIHAILGNFMIYYNWPTSVIFEARLLATFNYRIVIVSRQLL